MTITQTIDIPADRRITLEVPPQIPAGRTQVIIQFPATVDTQQAKPSSEKDNGKIHLTKSMVNEMLRDETLLSLTGILHTDMTLDEIRKERLAKYL